MTTITVTAKAEEGNLPAKTPSPWDTEHTGQPDPVTLSEPCYDDSGRLRWGSPRH